MRPSLSCAVCGDSFRPSGERRAEPVCCDTCRSTLAYWRARGLVRLRVRIRMRELQDASLRRIERLLAGAET